MFIQGFLTFFVIKHINEIKPLLKKSKMAVNVGCQVYEKSIENEV